MSFGQYPSESPSSPHSLLVRSAQSSSSTSTAFRGLFLLAVRFPPKIWDRSAEVQFSRRFLGFFGFVSGGLDLWRIQKCLRVSQDEDVSIGWPGWSENNLGCTYCWGHRVGFRSDSIGRNEGRHALKDGCWMVSHWLVHFDLDLKGSRSADGPSLLVP